MTTEIRKKAEQIARMLRQGYGLQRTASMMRLTYHGLLRITKTPEYQMIEDMEREKADKIQQLRSGAKSMRDHLNEEMEDAVPEAWCVLIDNLHQKDMKAALEVLDRDPQRQFSKGTHNTTTQFGVQVMIDSQALAQAVKDADRTHELIDRASRVKPAEA